jgi:hypothetical protein
VANKNNIEPKVEVIVNYIIDPEGFRNKVVPAFLGAFRDLEIIKAERAMNKSYTGTKYDSIKLA